MWDRSTGVCDGNATVVRGLSDSRLLEANVLNYSGNVIHKKNIAPQCSGLLRISSLP